MFLNSNMNTLTILPRIETPHLILREIEVADANEFAAFMTQSRYQRFISHRLSNEAEVAAFVRRHVAVQGEERRRIYHLAAEEKITQEVVGDGFIIAHPEGSYEIGWGVHPALWRLGFGTEIGEGLLGLVFETLNATNCWCKVMEKNTPSQHLARRVGFKPTHSKSDYPLQNGQREPVQFYQMTSFEYFDRPYFNVG